MRRPKTWLIGALRTGLACDERATGPARDASQEREWRDPMPWHLTPVDNLPAILRDGLLPAIGPRSAALGEMRASVHLFSDFASLDDADWLESAFDDDQQLCLLHVDVPCQEGAWTEVDESVLPGAITVISMDFDNLPTGEYPALHMLDLVEDMDSDTNPGP